MVFRLTFEVLKCWVWAKNHTVQCSILLCSRRSRKIRVCCTIGWWHRRMQRTPATATPQPPTPAPRQEQSRCIRKSYAHFCNPFGPKSRAAEGRAGSNQTTQLVSPDRNRTHELMKSTPQLVISRLSSAATLHGTVKNMECVLCSSKQHAMENCTAARELAEKKPVLW